MLQGKRGLICLLLVLVMVTSLFAGCAKDPVQSGDEAEATQEAESTEAATEEVDREWYEFEMYWNYSWYDNSDSWDPDVNLIAAEIKDKFNLGFTVSAPTGDDAQKLNLMLASDEFPEVIICDRNDKWVNLIKANALVPLNDYIAKYEGYRTEVPETTINMLKQPDGESYGFACFAVRPENFGSGAGFVINQQIYEELGSPKLDTLDDLYNYLVMVRDSGMEIEGQKVIPLEMKKDLNFDALGVFWGTFGDQRYSGETGPNKVRKQGDKLELVMKDEKFDDLMLYMNKLYTEKLLSQDYFVETAEQVDEKLATGRVAVFVSPDCQTQINTALQALEAAGSSYTYTAIHPPAAEGVNQADIATGGGNTLGWNVCSITKDAEKPERIYEYLDWTVTPEGNRLIKYGPQGYAWDELDENGVPFMKEGIDYTQKTPEVPFGANQVIGNSNFLNTAANVLALRSENPPWELVARTQVFHKYIMDATEYVNMIPVEAGTEAFDVYADIGQYVLDQYTQMIVADSEEEVLEVIDTTIAELERRNFAAIEEHMNNVWKSNRQQMGLE